MPYYVAADITVTDPPDPTVMVPEHVYSAAGPEVPDGTLNEPVRALCGAQGFIHINARTGHRVELASHWEADSSFCESCGRLRGRS